MSCRPRLLRSLGSAWPRVLLLAVLIGATLASNAGLTDRQVEYRIKAAFVCKFGSYVEWPSQAFAQAKTPLTIGVAAADSVVDEIARTAAGESIEGRPIAVRRLTRGDTVNDLHILFIARSHNTELTEALASVRGRPVLTVTEADQPDGVLGMVNFVIIDDKVRFDIALPPAELSGLKISARLLGVARKVHGKPS